MISLFQFQDKHPWSFNETLICNLIWFCSSILGFLLRHPLVIKPSKSLAWQYAQMPAAAESLVAEKLSNAPKCKFSSTLSCHNSHFQYIYSWNNCRMLGSVDWLWNHLGIFRQSHEKCQTDISYSFVSSWKIRCTFFEFHGSVKWWKLKHFYTKNIC